MPRNSAGVFTLAQAPFVPNTIISSSAMNSNLADIAVGLTQSLATTGVSTMTGPIKAADGSVSSPSYTFSSSSNTGFYLAGSDQIGWSSNGVLGATFNSDLSVTWAGAASWAGAVSFLATVSLSGNIAIAGSVSVGGRLYVASTLQVSGQIVASATVSVQGPLYASAGTFSGLIIASTSVSVTGGLYVGATAQVSGNLIASASASITGPLYVAASVSVGGDIIVGGSLAVVNNVSLNGSGTQTIGSSSAIVNLAGGGAVLATASLNINRYLEIQEVSTPASATANSARLYISEYSINANSAIPFIKDENGYTYPVGFNGAQCKLTKSGTSLLLAPFGGNLLAINGVPQTIPNAGISLAASNTAGVFVYIYAFMNAATMTLEMSTTAPTIQTSTGIQQKTADSTRTLVGAAYTDTGGAWADTDGKLWVLSYFNRSQKASKTQITASLNSNSATFVEVDSNMRNNFITWGNEIVSGQSSLLVGINNTARPVFSQIQTEAASVVGTGYSNSATNLIPSGNAATGKISGLTENATHYLSLFARNTDGATTFIASLATVTADNSQLYVYVNG